MYSGLFRTRYVGDVILLGVSLAHEGTDGIGGGDGSRGGGGGGVPLSRKLVAAELLLANQNVALTLVVLYDGIVVSLKGSS